jgi:hypothetical protein
MKTSRTVDVRVVTLGLVLLELLLLLQQCCVVIYHLGLVQYLHDTRSRYNWTCSTSLLKKANIWDRWMISVLFGDAINDYFMYLWILLRQMIRASLEKKRYVCTVENFSFLPTFRHLLLFALVPLQFIFPSFLVYSCNCMFFPSSNCYCFWESILKHL